MSDKPDYRYSWRTPIKSIRSKCLDCTAESPSGVRECAIFSCSLWPYRMGKRPKKGQKKLRFIAGKKQEKAIKEENGRV